MTPLLKAAKALREAVDALEEYSNAPQDIRLPEVSPQYYMSDLPPDPNLTLNQRTLEVTWKGVPLKHVTPHLFGLLEYIQRRPGVIRSRTELVDAAWPDNYNISDRVVDTSIKRLRIRFREVDPDFKSIESVWGVGYRWKTSERMNDELGTV